ncbi:uncharacterized protein LOC112455007 [Temnothorax curvispinosus]|uniref:Uncharacterized protein LOC112455007 n=1 Tax=Temnothorax curvispinosus TaxID=300111 RepID=A0A6J1PT63_9HYME|nr:uncharacterized protein LOC112455007 [Temnothorax curvispinosus]
MVDGVRVPIKTGLKLLGLWLDGTWGFGKHVARTASKAAAAANSLCRLMPNLRRVGSGARRLYAGVVHSIALYGAPIWAPKMMATESLKAPMRRVQRLVAIWVARAYRTTSHAAASTLASLPPMELLADKHAYVFRRTRELQRRNVEISARVKKAIRQEAATALLAKWEEYLDNPALPGRRVVSAVRPVLEDWVNRRGRGLTFHMTQVLTGHGCFGEYLCRIDKERTTQCHHCAQAVDSAQHTLEHCPAWAEERRVLRASVGEDLSLPAIVAAMVEREQNWRAVASFCGGVMAAKEEAERIRRGEQPAPDQTDVDGDGGVFRRPRGLPPRNRRWRPPPP